MRSRTYLGVTLLAIASTLPTVASANNMNSDKALFSTFTSRHPWLERPGFYAVLGSVVDKSFVFIQSTDDGLIFRACSRPEASDGGGGRGGHGGGGKAMAAASADAGAPDGAIDEDPTHCETILNNEDLAIPPELVLRRSLGLGHIMVTALRVIADGSVIAAVDMGSSFAFAKTVPFSIAAVSAKSWSQVNPENPLTSIMDLAHAEHATRKLLEYGDMSNAAGDGQIVTVFLTQRFPDILDGITQELLGIVKKELKHDRNGSLGLKWELDYHSRMNAELHPPKAEPAPAPVTSAPVTPVPVTPAPAQ